MNNSEEGCAKCCFWDTPGMQCTKDCGDLNGTYCSQCKDWFCGYHDKVIIHHNKPELDDVCIYCLVPGIKTFIKLRIRPICPMKMIQIAMYPLKVSETNLRTKQTLVHYLGSQTKILIQSHLGNLRIYQQLFDLLPHDYI